MAIARVSLLIPLTVTVEFDDDDLTGADLAAKTADALEKVKNDLTAFGEGITFDEDLSSCDAGHFGSWNVEETGEPALSFVDAESEALAWDVEPEADDEDEEEE